jgi:hypothetical protein
MMTAKAVVDNDRRLGLARDKLMLLALKKDVVHGRHHRIQQHRAHAG